MNSDSNSHPETKPLQSKVKIFLLIFEVTLILTLLIIWFCSKSIQSSKSLIVLFFYSFPSEFIVGLVPHEPVLLYYGKYYSPFTVALVAVTGTVLAEALNYSVFSFINSTRLFEKMRRKKIVSKIVELFNKAPFTAIIIAGFTPVPFFPIRFLVVMSNYLEIKYLLAVFLSRAPRFYILAFLGDAFKIPDNILIVLFIILIITAYVSLIVNLKKNHGEINKTSDQEM